MLGPGSSGLHQAADNLLRKAVRAVRDGDQARARRFVERALDLPFDEYEQIGPAWWSASMLIFTAITDYAEDCEVGDDSLLTAAEHLLGQCDPLAAPAVLGCLAAIVNDFSMSAVETRRCRRLVATTPSDGWDEHEPTDRAQRLTAILAVLHCVVAYETTATRPLTPTCSDDRVATGGQAFGLRPPSRRQ